MFVNKIFLVLVPLILFGSCLKQRKKQEITITQISVINEDSLAVDVDFNIKEFENVNVGLCWSDYNEPSIKDSYTERFLTDDSLIRFYIPHLYANHEYHFRAFINTNQIGDSEYLYSADTMFKTAKIAAAPCTTNANEVDVNGTTYAAQVLYHDDFTLGYTVACAIGGIDVDFIFSQEPGSGIFKTTKTVNGIGAKEVRIQAKSGNELYSCDSGGQVFIHTTAYSGSISVKYSFSFCSLNLKRYDEYGNGDLVLSGQILEL